MSEQKESFMQQLDAWTDQAIIAPLMDDVGPDVRAEIQVEIHKAIRAKVLESYKNGLKAGAVGVRKELSHAQTKTR